MTETRPYATTGTAYDATYNGYGPSRLSWQGIIAGVVTALAVQMVLGLVGAAIGLSMVHEAKPGVAPSPEATGIGALLWTAVSMLTALYYGGFIAARVSKHVTRTDGVVQGVVVWASTVLVTVTMLSGTVGSVMATTAPAPHHMNRPADMGPMNHPQGGPAMENGMVMPNQAMQAPTPAQAQADDRAAHDAAIGTALAAVVFLLGAIVAAFGGRLGTDHANQAMAAYARAYPTTTV